MDLIAESESGTASSTDILNCADSLRTKKLKKKETEIVLNKFVQDKWLKEVGYSFWIIKIGLFPIYWTKLL